MFFLRPNSVLIIAFLRLFLSLSVPWPKSSSIALTLCLIPPLVHAPPIYLSLFPLKERCTPFQFGTSSFFGAFHSPEQIWWSIFPLLNWTWRIPSLPTFCQPIPTHTHFCTTTSVLYFHLTFLLTLNNPNAITSNYPAQPRLPFLRVYPDCPDLFFCSVSQYSKITQLKWSLYPSSTFHRHQPYIPGLHLQLSCINPRGMCSLVLQWLISDLIKASSSSCWFLLCITHYSQ